jgi:hypothetical protein
MCADCGDVMTRSVLYVPAFFISARSARSVSVSTAMLRAGAAGATVVRQAAPAVRAPPRRAMLDANCMVSKQACLACWMGVADAVAPSAGTRGALW